MTVVDVARFARARDDALGSPRPYDVECVGAADPNIDLVTFLEVQDLNDLGRQPKGEIVTPLLDFHRPLLDGTHIHLDGAAFSVNAAL
jgi:hypothetical protein